MKKKAIPKILIVCTLLLTITGCSEKIKSKKEVNKETPGENSAVINNENEEDTIFYVDDIEDLHLDEEFKISNYYIRNKVTGLNHYYIDANNVLWGTGRNSYLQMGLINEDDINNLEPIYYDVKIAENVIHVDCSVNGYFMIYLTDTGELYGVGANLNGVLCEPVNADDMLNPWMNLVSQPKLLMEDVVYARSGRESITVLKEDGSVWWWGQFLSTSLTKQTQSHMENQQPQLMLEDAIYAVCGDIGAAAITKNGELYTWGCNTWGQCGVACGPDDYIRNAVKAADNVKIVWLEDIGFETTNLKWTEDIIMDYNDHYEYNTFIQTRDGALMACGIGLGKEKKVAEIYEDTEGEKSSIYSSEFLSISISEKPSKQSLQ